MEAILFITIYLFLGFSFMFHSKIKELLKQNRELKDDRYDLMQTVDDYELMLKIPRKTSQLRRHVEKNKIYKSGFHVSFPYEGLINFED